MELNTTWLASIVSVSHYQRVDMTLWRHDSLFLNRWKDPCQLDIRSFAKRMWFGKCPTEWGVSSNSISIGTNSHRSRWAVFLGGEYSKSPGFYQIIFPTFPIQKGNFCYSLWPHATHFPLVQLCHHESLLSQTGEATVKLLEAKDLKRNKEPECFASAREG